MRGHIGGGGGGGRGGDSKIDIIIVNESIDSSRSILLKGL